MQPIDIDLADFGHAAYSHIRGTSIRSSGGEAENMEYLVLRLGLWARGYDIIEVNEVEGEHGWVDVEYVLNMPYATYEELTRADATACRVA